jgi:uncharacterized protein YjbJ (UPF0337 family)
MIWDRIEGNWKQFKGNVKQHWGKLNDDQLDVIAGKRDQLDGKIQELSAISKRTKRRSKFPPGRTARRKSVVLSKSKRGEAK